jgi:transcription initiation factor IIE alpha subunit
MRKGKAAEAAKEGQEEDDDDETRLAKADLARVEERATLRHKKVTKKLKFYDKNKGKDSTVVSKVDCSGKSLRVLREI